jgi:hypothetical protein
MSEQATNTGWREGDTNWQQGLFSGLQNEQYLWW